MTAVLAATASGQLLPPQLLYQGKTDKCLPAAVNFPKDWDVHHSPNHWSNTETMVRYIDTIINPYVESQRKAFSLPQQQALCIFDVFKAHQAEEVLQKLKSNNIHCVFVPASCTGELQPLDVSVNKVYKEKLKACFEQWYSDKVEAQLNSGVNIASVQVNLSLTNIKPIHAKWIISAHKEVESRPDLIKVGFAKSGIVSYSGGASDDTWPPPSPDVVDGGSDNASESDFASNSSVAVVKKAQC